MIIYPTHNIKDKAREFGIVKDIERIKSNCDDGNRVEGGLWPIELDLNACKNL